MKLNFVALLSGVIFGLGLALSQMIDPNKVLNFLDVTGNWDPSLAFVMMGALAVSILSFRFIFKRSTPVLETDFHVSRKSIINRPLLLGVALFGIGWGMIGCCPGPAVASLGLLSVEGFIMVISIYAGFFSHRWFAKNN
ncbi:YeeE/YedE family protein [Methylococcaceae bacterium HT1]|nr:YeeE/YedE family protein [Methylococcaceae bacterium HT1]TXL14675.1 YeeE/YedE family protein [Methylococcaceae bacterium HT3]TXL22717.1 YeeE/YedE family protein [Methylococcaceae bacterium HT2]